MAKWFWFILLVGLMCAPVEARAENMFGVGFGVGVSPYRDYDTKWSFYPVIRYENGAFFMQDLSLGLKLYQSDPLEFAVYVAYDPTNFDHDDTGDRRLRRLDDRHEGILAGGRVRWSSPMGDFRLSLAGDISGHSEGFKGRLTYFKTLTQDNWSLTPQIGLDWADDSYNDYYYGVSAKEATASGLARYRADSSVSAFLGLGFTLRLGQEERWQLHLHGEVADLPSEIKDSPMVDRTNVYRFSTGLSYRF